MSIATADNNTETTAEESSDLLETAQEYAERGWYVIPIPLGSKKPILREWTNLRLTAEDLPKHFNGGPSNIGLLLGEASGGVVDIDLDCPESVLLAGQILPPTRCVFGRPGKPSSHWLYNVNRIPNTEQFSDMGGSMLVELRSTGGQTVVPPSMHPSGESVRWEQDGEPALVNTETLRKAISELAAASIIARHWPNEGSRHDASNALAGGFLRAGWPVEKVEWFILAVAQAARDEEMPARLKNVMTTARRLSSNQTATGWPTLAQLLKDGQQVVSRVREWLEIPPDPAIVEIDTCTDLGNAQRLVEQFGENLRYCGERKSWMVWTGTRWERDTTGQVERWAKDTVKNIYHEAANAQEKDTKKLGDWAKASASLQRIRNMIALAQTEPSIPISTNEFDREPYLLNFLNGTLDLRTGELRSHQREDLITKLVPVKYDSSAKCGKWLGFLDRIMAGNEQMIEFIQRALGYALTGDTSEQVIFILHGSGANGKTTLIETAHTLLGDYAQKAEMSTFLTKRNDSIRNDIAQMQGVRFISAVESARDKKLDETLVKQMTGGDTVRARFLFQESFEFRPSAKIFLATNHKPDIKESDLAIWRRIRLIPFHVTIPEAEQDRKLGEKLRDELPGILAWAVQGCLSWQRNRLAVPEAVKQATDDYRDEMDVVGNFLSDCCIQQPTAIARVQELWKVYVEWCQQNGETPSPSKEFNKRIREKGFHANKGTNGYTTWRGLGLLTEPNAVPSVEDDQMPF
jgi:putative DNA primase/helicase